MELVNYPQIPLSAAKSTLPTCVGGNISDAECGSGMGGELETINSNHDACHVIDSVWYSTTERNYDAIGYAVRGT